MQTHPAFAATPRPSIASRNPTLSVFIVLCVVVVLPPMRQGRQQQQEPRGQQQQHEQQLEENPCNGDIIGVGGVAYGGYARKVVGRALDRLPGDGTGRVEDHPEVLSAALQDALLLVEGLKRRC